MSEIFLIHDDVIVLRKISLVRIEHLNNERSYLVILGDGLAQSYKLENGIALNIRQILCDKIRNLKD